jgi:hypothetical protein
LFRRLGRREKRGHLPQAGEHVHGQVFFANLAEFLSRHERSGPKVRGMDAVSNKILHSVQAEPGGEMPRECAGAPDRRGCGAELFDTLS